MKQHKICQRTRLKLFAETSLTRYPHFVEVPKSMKDIANELLSKEVYKKAHRAANSVWMRGMPSYRAVRGFLDRR